MRSDRPVEARGLVTRYGAITAVDNVDLTVEPGDVNGFVGPNGAGKTTTLRMLLGLIRPDDGEARLFGRDPQHELPEALEGVAGFVETPYFYSYLSGRKDLELLAAFDLDGAAWVSAIFAAVPLALAYGIFKPRRRGRLVIERAVAQRRAEAGQCEPRADIHSAKDARPHPATAR